MTILLHSLFTYSSIFLALVTFTLYTLSFNVLKNTHAFRYALMFNGLLVVLSLLSVVTGFGVSNIPLVASKTPFVWGFPHKWNGLVFFIISTLTFVIFLFKGNELGKKGYILSLLVFALALFQLFTGWMMKLIFFS